MSKEQELLEKVPPHSIEAEESILGALLIDKDAIIKVADNLTAEDFYRDGHKIIFEAMRELYANQEPIDIITISKHFLN